MKKEVKLVKKVNDLIKKAKLPRWLHRYGPKTYEFLHHAIALLMRAYCRLSFRRVKRLFDLLGIKCPSKSALHYTTRKIPVKIWQYLLSLTTSCNIHIAAIDSTGFNKAYASQYYLKRINKNSHNKWTKLSAMVDTKRKKIVAAKIRVKPSHDIRDVKFLLKNKPRILVADKAYDAEWLHEHCYNLGIKAHIPVRRWSKGRWKNMGYRIKASKRFDKKIYGRREIAEAIFSAVKRKFGSGVSAKKAVMQKAELYCRLICYNLFSFLFRDLGQRRIKKAQITSPAPTFFLTASLKLTEKS